MKRLLKFLLVMLMVFGLPLVCSLLGPDVGYTAWQGFKWGLLIECLLVICMPWWGIPLIILMVAMI